MPEILRKRVGREAVKLLLGPLLRWRPLKSPVPGYSIVLGVPWDLRHLLPVNLRFVQATDRTDLHRIHVVFDRREREGAEELIVAARGQFPDLPLTFRFYPSTSGRIIETVNVSTFYNSMNTVLALSECETRYAVLHDFDLYPIVPEYFRTIHEALRDRELHFSGLELTHFDGLTDEDRVIGTWCLGIDVQRLREEHAPIDCFHKVVRRGDRVINLDPYSHTQLMTERRELAKIVDTSWFCHVRNLCSTYLRFITGRWAQFAWRLHYLWYLESLIDRPQNFEAALAAMRTATEPTLSLGDYDADFSTTHPTCANVLRDELTRMDSALFGECRPLVREYADVFGEFLTRVYVGED